MQYVAVYLTNQDGSRSNRRYTFHTETTDFLGSNIWMCETQYGIAFGIGAIIANEPDFETKRAIRITKDIFEQARMYENINKGS